MSFSTLSSLAGVMIRRSGGKSATRYPNRRPARKMTESPARIPARPTPTMPASPRSCEHAVEGGQLERRGQPGQDSAGDEDDVLGQGQAEAAEEAGRRTRTRSRRGGTGLRPSRPGARASAAFASVAVAPPGALSAGPEPRASYRTPGAPSTPPGWDRPDRRGRPSSRRWRRGGGSAAGGESLEGLADLAGPGGHVGGDGERQLEAGLGLLRLQPVGSRGGPAPVPRRA